MCEKSLAAQIILPLKISRVSSDGWGSVQSLSSYGRAYISLMGCGRVLTAIGERKEKLIN